MNDITKLLNIEEENLEVVETKVTSTEKRITLEMKLFPHYCPQCECRMYSRGIKTRFVKHQIMQDGYAVILEVKQRRWLCSNPDCQLNISDHFSFVERYKKTTNLLDFLVLQDLQDINKTFAQIAKERKITDYKVISILEKHIRMKRLPLPEAISVDEVYLNMDPRCKYVLVIQDFKTGDAIDLVKSRQEKDTLPYFAAIPIEERLRVKYLISDMYNPYISYVDKYFPKAISVIDSFHVMQWLIHKIDQFLRDLLRQYRSRDREQAEIEAKEKHYSSPVYKLSDEVYLLDHYKWLLLKNEENLDLHPNARWNSHFHCYVDDYFIESRFMAIHSSFSEIRILKEEYVSFNSRNVGNPEQAAVEIEDVIYHYQHCDLEIFRNFSNTLIKHKKEIINSFILHERIVDGKTKTSRLSNGPMESLNRKAKDIQRMARGYTNFEHLRNRFLYVTRKNPTING